MRRYAHSVLVLSLALLAVVLISVACKGNGALIPKTPKTWSGAVSILQAERVQAWVDQWNQVNGSNMSSSDYFAACDTHLKQLVGSSDIYIRVRDNTLAFILKDGRLKSIFEIKKPDNPGVVERAIFEEKFFGLPRELDPEKRPIYGALGQDPDGRLKPEHNDSLKFYGNVALRMKNDVKNRATFTHGDTLVCTESGNLPVFEAAPVLSPNHRAGFYSLYPWYFSAVDPLTEKSTDEVKNGYFEVQVFGGVQLNDIEEVIFAPGIPDVGKYTASLDAIGIPWHVTGGGAK